LTNILRCCIIKSSRKGKGMAHESGASTLSLCNMFFDIAWGEVGASGFLFSGGGFMKKFVALAFLFLVIFWRLPLCAAEPKTHPPVPKEVTSILAEVNKLLKTEKTQENLGFITRTPRREIYPVGILHITGQTKNNTAFVIDVYIMWISPEEDAYIIPDLVAGESVPAVWWWKNGKRFSWKSPKSDEDGKDSATPRPQKPKGTSI